MLFFAMLSIAMVIVSYIFMLAVAAACVLLPYWIIASTESPNGQVVLALLFGIAIAAAILWSLVPRRDKFQAPGLVLDKAQQPRLFDELSGIAASLNEPMPREVYLIGDVNAWVADRGGVMGFGSRRVMGLGLPLFSILTISEFRAVLAHEFAHYYGGDTSLGPWVYKTQNAIVRVFQNIGSVGKIARTAILGVMYLFVAKLMEWYFKVFLRGINLASRQREYRADELACLIAGRKPLIGGLRAIHGGSAAWPAFWQTELVPILNKGAVPGITDGFARFTSVPHINQQIQKHLNDQLRDAKTNPYDSHPPLRDRIAAIEKLASIDVSENDRPAHTLLDHAEGLEIRLLEHLNPDVKTGTLTSVSWDEVAAKVTIPAWRQFAQEYSSALAGMTADSLPQVIPNLQRIGNGMRDPKGMLLGPEQRRDRAGSLIAIGFALGLLERGWKLNHSPGIFSLSYNGLTLDPFLVMEQFVKGKISEQDWKMQCAKLQIEGLMLGPSASEQLNLSLPESV